jgi:hypothetical protein
VKRVISSMARISVRNNKRDVQVLGLDSTAVVVPAAFRRAFTDSNYEPLRRERTEDRSSVASEVPAAEGHSL